MSKVKKEVKLKYTGKNPSYTAGKTKFKKNGTNVVDGDIADILLKYDYFEEVEDEQPTNSKKQTSKKGDKQD